MSKQPALETQSERDARFAELDALIAAGYGDTPGDKIPDYEQRSKTKIVGHLSWDSSYRSTVRRHEAPRFNDLNAIISDQIREYRPRKDGPAHDHHWTRMGKYGSGEMRLRCKRCGRTRITGKNTLQKRREAILIALANGLSIRRAAIDAGCSRNTVFRTKKLMEAGMLE